MRRTVYYLRIYPTKINEIHGSANIPWVVVSNIFYFQPYLGKWSILTNIFQMGWNHQLVPFVPWIRPGMDICFISKVGFFGRSFSISTFFFASCWLGRRHGIWLCWNQRVMWASPCRGLEDPLVFWRWVVMGGTGWDTWEGIGGRPMGGLWAIHNCWLSLR